MALVRAPVLSAGDEKPLQKANGERPADRAKEGPGAEEPKDDQPAAPPAEGPKTDEVKVFAGPDGFVIQSGSPEFKIRIGGYAHVDGRFYAGQTDYVAVNTFLLRRARINLQGTVAKYFDFEISPDFGQGQTVLYDAFLNVRPSSKLQFKFGKFKPPVGLERLFMARNLVFVERALPTGLVPNRDVGAQVHGELGSGVATYALGLFNGAVDGALIDADSNSAKDVAGRVFFQPFARGGLTTLKGLGLGFSATSGKQQGALPSFRSGGQIVFFSYLSTAAADGNRTRFSPQGSFFLGPFGVFGEYIQSRQQVRQGADAAQVANQGWEVSSSVLVTGERATATGVRPRRPFDPSKGTWGALELAARVNGLTIDPVAFSHGYADPARSARTARAWAFGLNWYLNRNVKYEVNFERTRLTGGAGAGGNRQPENAILVRSQVAF
jgi:phosphate-selective porin OprO/OprP